ncbi:helix-turn-helix domain-containing protein [Geodermatophilus sabuli]|uniref:Transcriptional regulator, XRE family n=1 Tax=Geodermatophilus sabuli TaxID=1564158 RepID=A0A285EE51_9ACTN|nr:helix-turn-helix transcriptional regulator [Geodermatophilus sabuli]MBB3086387.1 transcriptional regulator with XRE-family HTH domain [Geodermatophilus sabuli]SNX97398.1 transcriptional regulator, XRE family [Geodermatophilus sabuli]
MTAAMTAVETRPSVGELLRNWRQRRRLSQLDLASDAGVSTRHLSFVETGRARPSREMVLHLAEQLEVPLRERNELLLAAGYAPVYGRRRLEDPDMSAVRSALDLVLTAYEPSPAVVVDRFWELVAGNRSIALLTEGVDPALLEPPVNVLRLGLHPRGLAPRILDLPQWRTALLTRLAREAHLTADPGLAALHRELAALPGGFDRRPPDGIAVPLRIRHGDDVLSFLSTVTTFGTAVDLTAAELSVEAFLPADAHTAEVLRRSRLPAPAPAPVPRS